jgi:pimeloyl-ACP methyl ester carboxylesterase
MPFIAVMDSATSACAAGSPSGQASARVCSVVRAWDTPTARSSSSVIRSWICSSVVLHAAARTASSLRDVTPLTDLVGRLLVFAPGDSTEAVRTARADFLATDPGVLARTTLASVSDDGSQLAPSLRVPTLILRGDHDKEASAADTRLLLSRLPDGHLITIPGAGHMLPLTESDIVAHHIRDWVTRIHRPAPSTDPSDLPT